MKNIAMAIFLLIVLCSSAFAQSRSGNAGKPGWTSDNELQWSFHEALYQQKLQKQAAKEQKQGFFGFFSRELQDRQTVKLNNGLKTGRYK